MWFTDVACYEFSPDGACQWEYVPLGTFHIDTPTKRKVATISCEALDGIAVRQQDHRRLAGRVYRQRGDFGRVEPAERSVCQQGRHL